MYFVNRETDEVVQVLFTGINLVTDSHHLILIYRKKDDDGFNNLVCMSEEDFRFRFYSEGQPKDSQIEVEFDKSFWSNYNEVNRLVEVN